MTSSGSTTEETPSLKHSRQQELESGGGGQAKQEETVAGGAETIPEKWGKGLGQGNEDKELRLGWGGRLILARCAEKE